MAQLTNNALRITDARVILPDRVLDHATLVVRDGCIAGIGDGKEVSHGSDTVIDAAGAYIAPGFIDIHVHGGAGDDFMDGTAAAFETVLRCHLKHGVTSVAPTNTVGTHDRIMQFFKLVRRFKEASSLSTGLIDSSKAPLSLVHPSTSRVLGAHLYGPYFAEEKVGCHPRDCRPPTEAEYLAYFDYADCMLLATCAPELPGAVDFYHAAAQRGVRLNAGHSNATWSEMQNAYDAGVRHIDHFFCAMSNYVSTRSRVGTPMQGGMLEYVLASSDMTTEIIADGRHLSPELMRFPLRMLGVDRVALVSDSSRALDCPPGDYIFGSSDGGEPFYSDGSVGLTLDRIGLASSVRGMDFMVRQMVNGAGVALQTAVRMASLTPAKILGLEQNLGSLEVGKIADLVMLDDDLQVARVWLEGRETQLG